MKGIKFLICLLAVLSVPLSIFLVLKTDIALVTNPKGLIANQEFDLIVTNVLLILAILVPTYITLFLVIWHAKRSKKYDPEHPYGIFRELFFWGAPSVIVAIMAVITWDATHKLDPYRPIESDIKPLTIQVVALNWKWLFIYPEQGIATVNFVQFPARTPIRFELSADGSPMNSFWIPQLSGQIYSMTGMITKLHIMADEPGEYAGKAAEINGEGYADMTFVAKTTSQADFEAWIEFVKQSPMQLTDSVYNELLKPSVNNPIALYSYVENNLFNQIVMKPMHPK